MANTSNKTNYKSVIGDYAFGGSQPHYLITMHKKLEDFDMNRKEELLRELAEIEKQEEEQKANMLINQVEDIPCNM